MLSGSKRNSFGALLGSVPDFSPQSRMKLADSLVRFVAQGTSPVLCQRSGIQTVLAAAAAAGVDCGTTTGAVLSTTSANTASQRRHPDRNFIVASLRVFGRYGVWPP